MYRHRVIRVQTAWLALLDVCCLALAITAGVTLRLGADSLREYIAQHVGGWVYFCGAIVVANYVVGTYGIQFSISRFNLVVDWVFSLLVATAVLGLTSYAWFAQLIGRGVLAYSILAYAALSFVTKVLLFSVLRHSRLFLCRVAILGTGPVARRIRRMVESPFIFPPHRVCATVELQDVPFTGWEAAGQPVGTDTDVLALRLCDLGQWIRREQIETLIVATDTEQMHIVFRELRRLRFGGVDVLSAMHAAETFSGLAPLDLISDAWLLEACLTPRSALVYRAKRTMDIVIALAGLVLGSPLILMLAALIKANERHAHVFYAQDRVGQFGCVFRIYKFRTMVPGAEGNGAVWSPSGDSRVTPLGRFLRRFRLDEIPQLINVLNGDMSLVGPRPERPEFVGELENSIPHYNERLNVPPGITGWAQVRHPYGSTFEDAVRKLELDLFYVKNFSMSLDLLIILRTIRIVLFGMERQVK